MYIIIIYIDWSHYIPGTMCPQMKEQQCFSFDKLYSSNYP